MSYTDMIPLAKSAKWPLSATPKLPLSKTENEAPNWRLSKMVAMLPVNLFETKSITDSPVNIPAPTIKPTIWLPLSDDAKRPMDKVAEAYNSKPKYPLNTGPISGSP